MPKPEPRLTFVPQDGGADCGVAALATLCSLPYVRVFEAACAIVPAFYKTGLFEHQMIGIAAKLNIELRRKKKFDIKKDSGIIGLFFKSKHKRGKFKGLHKGHYVVLYKGLIIDPGTGEIWKVKHYVEACRVKAFDSFLERA